MKKTAFTYKNHKYEILDRPLSWMSPEKLAILQGRLKRVAAARFGHEPNYSYFSDTAFFKDKVIVICSDPRTGLDLCFCAMCYIGRYRERRIVHLGSVFSASENKGYLNYVYMIGLTYVALKAGPLNKIYVTSLTHTPKIFGIVADGFHKVYPNGRSDARPSRMHLALRDRLIDNYIKPEWDLMEPVQYRDDFVMPALRMQKSGEVMFPDTQDTVPKHRKDAFNRRILSTLNFERGDEILQVGEFRLLIDMSRKVFEVIKNLRKSRKPRVRSYASANVGSSASYDEAPGQTQ